MNSKSKWILYIKNFLLLIVGFIVGYVVKHVPYFTLDSDVNIIDLVTLIATVAIAFMIPVYIQKFIEDNRGVKVGLVLELKELLGVLSKVRTIITTSYTRGNFLSEDRDNILFAFNEAELKVNSIEEQFKVAYENESDEIINGIKAFLFAYNDFVTGGELMISSFEVIDQRFFREDSTEYSKIETGIKTLIQKVHKL